MCLFHRCIGVNTPSPTQTGLHDTVDKGVHLSLRAAMNTCDTYLSAAGSPELIKNTY